jgi:hypothetical protein
MQHFSHHDDACAWMRGDCQKKRRPKCQRWNTVSKRTNRFSKKTPPCPIGSGAAAFAGQSNQIFYCPFNSVIPFLGPPSFWFQFVSTGGHTAWRNPICTGLVIIHLRLLSDMQRLLFFSALIPVESATCLIFDDPRLEKVSLLFQIDHLAHPREWIFLLREHWVQTYLLCASICDEAQVALEHRGVQP